MAHLLIVEDDPNTLLLIKTRLKPYFTITIATNGNEALKAFYHQPPDLMITDIMMPEMDGYTLVKQLREGGFETPIIFLTAKHTLEDKRMGFSLGTDDYITKPIPYDELLWRVHALLRRSKINQEHHIKIGATLVDASTYSVITADETITLAKKEFDLLYKLLSYPNQIFTKAQLLDAIWGYDSDSGEETIRTHISRLRNRLSHCTAFKLITVKGLGYKAELTED